MCLNCFVLVCRTVFLQALTKDVLKLVVLRQKAHDYGPFDQFQSFCYHLVHVSFLYHEKIILT